jgi:hypothetical protein
MRVFKLSPYWITLVLGTLIVVLQSVVIAEPKKGGFFNKEELDRGFFAEPTAEPTSTMEAIPTTKVTETPSPTDTPTPPPISNADIARQIVTGGTESIEKLKAMQNDPNRNNQILQSLQGVRENVDRQIQNKLPLPYTPDPRPTPLSMVPPEDLLKDYQTEDLPATIQVVLKAEPRTTFLRTLDKIFIAVTKLKVTVTNIYVIGQNKDLLQFLYDREENFEELKQALAFADIPPSVKREALQGVQEAIPNTQILLEKLNFKMVTTSGAGKDIVDKFSIQSSPAWIIHSGGKTTTIQGEIDPREFLTPEGRLNPELRETELGGSPFGLLKNPSENAVTEFAYSPPPTPEPVIQKVLPICTKARIRRMKVGPATFGALFSPDMLIFSPEDPEQLELSEQYAGTAVAYSPMTTPAQAQAANPLLPFLLSQPLRCLPTRMHYVNVGGKQYMEFRQGAAAWKE